MLIRRYTPQPGLRGGEETEARTILTIALHDYHREYTISDDPLWTDRYYIREAWEPFSFYDLMGPIGSQGDSDSRDEVERRTEAAFDALFAGTEVMNADWVDEAKTQGTILVLEGTIDALTRACREYIKALDTKLGGDDDTYDYWPNTMMMIWEFCNDLDAERGPAGVRLIDELRNCYDRVQSRWGDDDVFAEEVLPRP